ncbi:MAG: sigma 54-interacting transcriptional regulator [Gammaproteobacteria bacterium]|jgi:transcriptional regulator with GAF, ATPase, and Fis domain|nr:sigma 54-interacting transcriptional regulator [Gammaproteobacteria bacterium]MCU0971359.1 sigma 54-interacting transcriptional regulator [Gammaproteobacteria bacterium]
MSERLPPTLVELSTRFTGLAVEHVDGEIERALRQLVEWLGTDRSTFFLIERDGQVRQTHTWVREGLPPAPASVTSTIPWYTGRLAAGEVVAFSRLPDELPATAAGERAYAEAQGLKSILTVPVALGGRHVCALSTGALRDHRSWDEATIDSVRLVAQIIANAVHRKRTEEQLQTRLDEIRALKDQLEEENLYLREEIRGGEFGDVVGSSPAIRRVLDLVSQVAPTDSAVLLLGETGTGKELLAQAIHDRSPRKSRPFIKVNCAALPATLIETELLGHERGAFTGAVAAHPGRFELADGGTLFLDEIGDLAVELQSKLLRVLQDGEVQRLGSTRPRKVDVRLVAATNQDLERAMAEGRFRRDLYYRLSVFPIAIPPLRERREDVPLIAWSFIERRQAKLGRHIEQIPREVMDALVAYDWPGNVRELQNVLERAVILSPGKTLRLDDPLRSAPGVLPGSGPRAVIPQTPPAAAAPAEDHRFDAVARDHVRAVLERCGWRINGPGGAAEVLAVHPNTLRSRMKRLGLERPQPSRMPR